MMSLFDTHNLSQVFRRDSPLSQLVRLAAETYGELRAGLVRSGMPLAEPDLRIASIGLSRNLTLVTGDLRHFSRVRGLTVENWIL